MRSVPSLALRYLLLAAAVLGAAYSLLRATANWLFEQDTAASVAAAVRLVPYDSAYVARLADWQPKHRVELLRRAVQLNPFDFESLIQLGITSEFKQHDAAAAERFYLQAEAVNKMFLPKWTLTNFYFRQGNEPEFFHWAEETLAITPYSPAPVFLQMWSMSQNATRIEHAIPNRPGVLLAYAWFLSNRHDSDLIPPVVRRLMGSVGKRDPKAWGRDDLLAAIEDRLVAGGNLGPALSVWKSMVDARWIQETVPTFDRPITNGDFRTAFFGHGFDWMQIPAKGVEVDQLPFEDLVRLQFSSDQPEHCVLLQQYVPLGKDRAYRFTWHFDSRLPDSMSGLTWHLSPVRASSLGPLASEDLLTGMKEGWQVRVPWDSGIALLTLEYSRPPGHSRVRGTATLSAVSAQSD